MNAKRRTKNSDPRPKRPTRNRERAPYEHPEISIPDTLAKIQNYCAYQERSHAEVRNKLFGYGLLGNQVDEIMTQLITDNFLNEERFAKAFAGGKFRMKKWGKLKITYQLEALGLTSNCIDRGLMEIDATDYKKALVLLLNKKAREIKEVNAFVKRNKVARFAIGKGYEPELVWELVRQVV